MGIQVFFNILILCAIASQGICALSKDNHTLSDILIRNKRIIDHSQDGRKIYQIHEVPYIVRVMRNCLLFCGGTIVSQKVILTAAGCVYNDHAFYHVVSGSHDVRQGIIHNVTKKLPYPHYNEVTYKHNLAVLQIDPPIIFEPQGHRPLQIFVTQKRPIHDFGIFSSWGCIYKDESGQMAFPDNLRTTTIPLLITAQCARIYAGIANITEREVCAFDENHVKVTCFADTGCPLVVDGKLYGIMSWTKPIPDRRSPEVFTRLGSAPYSNFIHKFIAKNTV